MEEIMSENNPGAAVRQPDNRNNDQGKDKRQRFDPSKQEGSSPRPRNQNHRRRNNGPRQGGNDNKKRNNGELPAEGKPQGQVQGQNQNRNPDRQNNRNKNKSKYEQNQGGEKKKFDPQNPKPRNKRQREIGDEVAKNVKKVETIDDIRSDNARITKEIYLEIASLKNINLN